MSWCHIGRAHDRLADVVKAVICQDCFSSAQFCNWRIWRASHLCEELESWGRLGHCSNLDAKTDESCPDRVLDFSK